MNEATLKDYTGLEWTARPNGLTRGWEAKICGWELALYQWSHTKSSWWYFEVCPVTDFKNAVICITKYTAEEALLTGLEGLGEKVAPLVAVVEVWQAKGHPDRVRVHQASGGATMKFSNIKAVAAPQDKDPE